MSDKQDVRYCVTYERDYEAELLAKSNAVNPA